MGKKILKILAGLGVFVLVILTVLYFTYNKPLPTGTSGPEAEALAAKMLNAINHEAYKETRFLEWSFARGAHHYKWDKKENTVEVKWKDFVVNLNLSSYSQSKATKAGVQLQKAAKEKAIAKAVSFFNNDSFWLVAPFKVFDPGTERGIVLLEDGSQALLVTYTSGGSTPGDSYLWKLGANGFPESFRMWVSIIPVGGLEASWEDWKIMESGVFLSTTHQLGPFSFQMENLKAYTP